MSHTNKTTYYELPQYVGTDIINPLIDTNGAYETIDTVMHNVASSVDGAVSDATEAKTEVETMASTVSGHTTDIADNAANIQKVSDIVAEAFDSTKLYTKGKVVIYNGKGYQFTSNHNGAWTGLDVDDYVVGDMTTAIEKDVKDITDAIGDNDISSIGDGTLTGAVSTINTDLTYKKIGTITMASTDLQGTFCSKLAALLSGKTGSILTDGSFKLMGEVFNGNFYANFLRMTASNCTIDYCTNASYLRTTLASDSTICNDLTSTATGSSKSIDVYLKE